MSKLLPDNAFPFAPDPKISVVPDKPEVQITINRLDLPDLARALETIANRREAQAKGLKPEKRLNMEARAIRLREMAEELLSL